MIASLTALLLAGAAYGNHPVPPDATVDDRITALARIAHTGDLTVAGMAEENREPRAVVDVDAAGCSVAFKTATSRVGFRAHIADFGRDLMIILVSSNEVQVIDKRQPEPGFILRSRRASTALHNELAAILEACRAANMIF